MVLVFSKIKYFRKIPEKRLQNRRILTYVILDIVQNKAINRTKPFIAFCQMIIAANLRFLRRGYFDLMA